MKALDDLMRSVREMAEPEPVVSTPETPVDLLLYSPCPVKLAVRDGIDAIATENGLSYYVPMGCTSVDPYDPIYKQPDPDKLPGLIASIGFGDFWRPEFVSRHVDAGVFEAALPPVVNPLHERAGLIDPLGRYAVYGVTAYVFLVDERRLGGLPAPRRWEDLLDPRYRGEIVMCGDGDDMSDAVAMTVYKDFGNSGLEALAANCKGLMHSSSMVASAGSREDTAGAIYVMPLFFAETGPRRSHIKVVWPSDGAAVSPLYLLAKKSERERLAPFREFFASGFASIGSAAWFVPMDGRAASPLPSDARLKWVGWDFIRDNDIAALRDKLNVIFRSMVAKQS